MNIRMTYLKLSVSSLSGGSSSGNYLNTQPSVGEKSNCYSNLFQNLDLGLSLGGSVGVIPPSVNEGLQVPPVLHLGLVFSLKLLVSLRFSCIELGEVSG